MRTNDPDSVTIPTVALLGSYDPRLCGIATFTKDLYDALAASLGPDHTTVLAMDDRPQGYPYPQEVRYQILADQLGAYHRATDMLNIKQVDVAIIQHEFGIYGGTDGNYVLELMDRLRMPIITTMHTVLTEPTPGQRSVVSSLAKLSDRLVVMSHLGQRILQDTYEIPDEKIAFIPHGIPDVPFVDTSFFKDQFDIEGRTVLLTFGLLSPGKGIEVAIKAIPKIVERHPNVVYLVLGATHPHVLKNQGDAYRHSLEALVDQLGIQDHVIFHNRFVALEDLCDYLGAADIYISPYPHTAQIVSGTLAYALGAGKAVISTPYWYAQEMLAGERGRLFPIGDSDKLADHVVDLLDNDAQRHAMRKRAYLHCRPMVWEEVARSYLRVAREIMDERNTNPKPVAYFKTDETYTASLSDPDLSHLRRLTDDTGILQHAHYAIPDRRHGYCTDDNARALVAALMYYNLQGDSTVLRLADVYLSFLHHAFNPETQRFRNFMSFDRQWLEEVGSEDTHGRALWSLGLATALAPNEAMLAFASRLFNGALAQAEALVSPRAWAFCLIGIHAYLRKFSGDSNVRRVRTSLANRLHQHFRSNGSPDWPWCEEVVTYDNAKLSHALILAGQWTPNPDMLDQGMRTLQWLVDLQTNPDNTASFIGNDGWMTRDGQRARFDQQPVEAMAMIEACAEAYQHTQDDAWLERAHRFLGWFTGNNDTHSDLYDSQTGGCRDGLQADGPNLNQGAESTLAWLISLLTVMKLDRTQKPQSTRKPSDELMAVLAHPPKLPIKTS